MDNLAFLAHGCVQAFRGGVDNRVDKQFLWETLVFYTIAHILVHTLVVHKPFSTRVDKWDRSFQYIPNPTTVQPKT